MIVTRPWGSFEVLDAQADHVVKRLTVKPGHRTSYQLHRKRCEHWYVLQGNASATIAGRAVHLPCGSSLDVASWVAHRLENKASSGDLVIIEVWRGHGMSEDDIERISDDYGRVP